MSNLKELSELAWQGELTLNLSIIRCILSMKVLPNLMKFIGTQRYWGFYVVDTNDGLVMIDAGSHLDIDSAYAEAGNGDLE